MTVAFEIGDERVIAAHVRPTVDHPEGNYWGPKAAAALLRRLDPLPLTFDPSISDADRARMRRR